MLFICQWGRTTKGGTNTTTLPISMNTPNYAVVCQSFSAQHLRNINASMRTINLNNIITYAEDPITWIAMGT